MNLHVVNAADTILWIAAQTNKVAPITHPHVVPNLWDIHSYSEHKLRYFWWNPRAFWPCIDRNSTEGFKAQKGSKDIIKIVHVTLVVQP